MNLNMISNYLKAKVSKGISNKKVDITTKDIRLLSCFGNGEDISVCPGLRPSEKEMGKFICGECGCGDGEGKYLNEDEGKYAKLENLKCILPAKPPLAGIAILKESEVRIAQRLGLSLEQYALSKIEQEENLV